MMLEEKRKVRTQFLNGQKKIHWSQQGHSSTTEEGRAEEQIQSVS
jgi:hypothetical protein